MNLKMFKKTFLLLSIRKSKNINMDVRQAPQSVSKDGMKIRPVGNTDSGRGLKIRSIKKS